MKANKAFTAKELYIYTLLLISEMDHNLLVRADNTFQKSKYYTLIN